MIEAAAGTKKGGTQPGNMVYNMRNGDSDKVKLLSDPVAQPTQPPQGNAGGTAVDWGQAWNAEPQAGPSKGAEMPGAGAAGSGPAPGRQNPGGMANTTLPVFKTREELREYLKQHPEARINGIDGQMLDDMEKKYGLGSPRNNEMLTNPTETIDIHDTPGHMPLTDLLKLSDEELDRMGVDRSQLDNARAQQGMQDVEKAHYDEIAKEAASQDGTRNPEREKKANEMLENVNISLPGDRILSGHSENGKPVIDGPIPITSEQRIQNVLESPQFISEDWDEIRPLDNDMLVPLGMLGQSIYGGGERLSPEGAKILSHEVAANPVFRDDVEKLIAENSNNSSFDTGEEQKNFSNAGRSLGLSLGNATVRIKGTKMKDGSWMIEFGGKDAYDYSEWKKGSTLADTANNWAYLNQGMGMIKPYPVRFSGAFVYPAK